MTISNDQRERLRRATTYHRLRAALSSLLAGDLEAAATMIRHELDTMKGFKTNDLRAAYGGEDVLTPERPTFENVLTPERPTFENVVEMLGELRDDVANTLNNRAIDDILSIASHLVSQAKTVYGREVSP